MNNPKIAIEPITLNEVSFRQIFTEYYDRVRSNVYRQTNDYELSDEITQRTFVKFWEKRDRIVVNQSILSYLYRSAKNTLFDHYRSREAHGRHNTNYASETERAVLPPQNDSVSARMKKIHWAIDQLKPKTREIFLLSRMEGLTMEEISKYKEIPRRTVEYQIKAAFKNLRSLMSDENL